MSCPHHLLAGMLAARKRALREGVERHVAVRLDAIEAEYLGECLGEILDVEVRVEADTVLGPGGGDARLPDRPRRPGRKSSRLPPVQMSLGMR